MCNDNIPCRAYIANDDISAGNRTYGTAIGMTISPTPATSKIAINYLHYSTHKAIQHSTCDTAGN